MSKQGGVTLSCGELKKAKFILSDNVNMGGNDFENLSKKDKDSEGDVYQIKRGARILKINSKEDLVKLLNKNSDKTFNIKGNIGKLSDEEYSKILDSIKETYDGISINHKTLKSLTKEERDLLGAKSGIKILNKEVLTNRSKGEENTSYRSGFKANATEISKEMREIASQAYMEGGYISSKISKFPMSEYSSDIDNNKTIFNGKDISEDIEKFKKASSEIDSKNLTLKDGVFSKIKSGKNITISSGDCFKTKALCEEALGRSVSHKEFMQCMSLYADGVAKSNTESYDKAYTKLKEKVLTGVERNSDGSFGKPILYADKRDLIADVSKEELHLEKMAWSHAISKANDEQKELLGEIAKIKLNPYQQVHLDNKLNDAVSYSIGDMEVKFYSTENANRIDEAVEPEPNKVSIKVRLSNKFESAKRIFSEKAGNLSKKRDRIVEVYNNTTSDISTTYNNAKDTLGTVYNNTKEELGKSYKNTSESVRKAYDNTKQAVGNAYEDTKKLTKRIGRSAKKRIERQASTVWNGIRNKVGRALITAGDSLQEAGNKVGKEDLSF